MNKNIILFTLTISMLVLASCKRTFLERLPEDRLTFENIPDTEEGVAGVTASLYNRTWFDFQHRLIYPAGEVASGNSRSTDSRWIAYVSLAVTSDAESLTAGWGGLYKVVSTANELIKNLEANKSLSTTRNPAIFDAGIGEAKFMRAAAYFYLVRLFGDVPLYEDAVPFIESGENLPKHKAADVYRFIERDLLDAENRLPLRSQRTYKRRVSKGSAQTMLAKVYLYQKRYADAKAKANTAIQSGEFGLMGLDFSTSKGYGDLFKIDDAIDPSNRESIFTLNWGFMPSSFSDYGIQNPLQAYFSSPDVSPGDGWGGSSNVPSVDLLEKYSAGDKRKNATVMTAGATYPNIVRQGENYVFTQTIADSRSTGAQIKKQVVGSPDAIGKDKVGTMCTTLPTYILRCSELYLIYAEATLGGANGSSISLSSATSDAQALNYYNKVRTRAGLATKSSITFQDILDERRLELAFEFDYYFDLGRLRQSEWTAIIAAQKRGTIDRSSGSPVYVPAVVNIPTKLTFPIPAGEIVNNPKLLEPAVDYTF